MIRNYSREDLLIGFFIVFALVYPFFITLLLFLEDVKERNSKMQELRAFYSFLLGLEECRQDRAQELSGLMSESLLHHMGGIEGLLRTCNAYRKAYPSARAEEKVLKEGELQVELIKKEKGMTQRLALVRLYYEGEGSSLKIERVEYEKGN